MSENAGKKMGSPCWQCKHVGRVPGSTHACCKHPEIEVIPLDEVLGAYGVPSFALLFRHAEDFGIKIDSHGAKNGWAAWPINYDPIWVSGCRKFEEREE